MWSGDPVADLEQARAQAEAIGFGGRRHVEVQVVADADGGVWTLGIRGCSVQRRNRQVIEESASTALDAEQVQLLSSSAAQLIQTAGCGVPLRT